MTPSPKTLSVFCFIKRREHAHDRLLFSLSHETHVLKIRANTKSIVRRVAKLTEALVLTKHTVQCFISPHTNAFSYTHLDVYKRQPLSSGTSV